MADHRHHGEGEHLCNIIARKQALGLRRRPLDGVNINAHSDII
jgi:hypothetical protein